MRLVIRILLLIIAIFAVAVRNRKENVVQEEAEKWQEPPILTLDEIWEIEDAAEFVIALCSHVGEKCGYGEAMSALSHPERVFYISQLLEMEVNNGGFDQFFFNSSGNFANELVDVFTEIGAEKTAEICKKAISVFDGEVPLGRDERDDMIQENDEAEEILEECDSAFYDYEEPLSELVYAYVQKNKAFFT
ncbi:MAG: DMP19 family protein [Oscillibacter sp.]|nr:DMP19 family protein [Oscillibacter sp.]